MYAYWRTRQTEPLIEEVKADDNLLVNLGALPRTGARRSADGAFRRRRAY